MPSLIDTWVDSRLIPSIKKYDLYCQGEKQERKRSRFVCQRKQSILYLEFFRSPIEQVQVC